MKGDNMRTWINKILHLFGYHLARDPKRRKKIAGSKDYPTLGITFDKTAEQKER